MTAVPHPEPAEAVDAPGATMTIDELSVRAGTTVRTTRYYASLGLIPPPERRGRVAYYGDAHLARLEMVRALQDHGFTLQAIERYLGSVSAQASTDELALQRAMLTSWTTAAPEQLSRRQLEKRAGRPLRDEEVETLVAVGAVEVEEGGQRYVAHPGFELGVEMLDLDVPLTSIIASTEAINRHMTELADELTDILRTDVVRPFRAEQHTQEEAARMQRTVAALRRLTMEGVVLGFQRAANQVIRRSLSRR